MQEGDIDIGTESRMRIFWDKESNMYCMLWWSRIEPEYEMNGFLSADELVEIRDRINLLLAFGS